jgi:hypothetical protein
MRSYYLCSYRPICCNSAGRRALTSNGLPPFIDGSCRREPDLESEAPSISAICRLTKFAPRLQPGDGVIYITVKGQYDGVDGWALVAVLNVVQSFRSHVEAASWYRLQGLTLPSNCLVPGNSPKEFHLTSRRLPKKIAARLGKEPDPAFAVRHWDHTYADRARNCGVFLACKADFLELWCPPVLQRRDLITIFGRVPGTQNPPKISRDEYLALMKFAGAGVNTTDV